MSFGYRLDWCAFCAVSIWLHVTSRLPYQLWIELRMCIGSFMSWFSHWRSFHQAGLLNTCWVPRDTWSVFKGKQLNHEKRETAVYSSTIALQGSYCKLCKARMAAWVPGALYAPSQQRPMWCSFWPLLLWEREVDGSWMLWAWTMFNSPEAQAGKTSGGFQAAPVSCSPLLLKFPQWRHPLRESRKSINK